MDSLTKNIVRGTITIGLAVNGWFIRELAVSVRQSHDANIQGQSTLQSMSREMSEVKEAVRGFQDLRIDVAILKHDVTDLKKSVDDKKGRRYEN